MNVLPESVGREDAALLPDFMFSNELTWEKGVASSTCGNGKGREGLPV